MTRPTSLRRAAGRLALALAFLVPPLPPPALARDPQPAAGALAYTMSIAATGNGALDAALRHASALLALRRSAPVRGFALAARARDDLARLTAVLHSFGYYAARLRLAVAGEALGTPGLLARLHAWPGARAVPITLGVTRGPLFHLRRIALVGAIPPGARNRLGLAPGAPAVASAVLAAGQRLLAALRERGYAFARVPPPHAVEYPALRVLDVTFVVQTGPRVTLGPIALQGLARMKPGFVARELGLRPGSRFAPSRIAAARRRILALGVFDTAIVQTAAAPDAAGQLPLTVLLHERPRHVISGTIAYQTDQGLGVSAAWTDRDLFSRAERLTLSAAVGGLGATAASGPTYETRLRFAKPAFPDPADRLAASLTALRQTLDAYDITSFAGEIDLTRTLGSHLSAEFGFGGAQEEILQEGVDSHYSLLDLPLRLSLDTTDNPLEPTRGVRGALTITPTVSVLGRGVAFVVMRLAASTYVDLEGHGRGVLALRGLIGGIAGSGRVSLPPDRRFYAGGSGTVRGYAYQSAGPLFPDGKPEGGTAITAATVEFRQRLWKSWGAVGFLDAAEVGTNSLPFAGTWHEGVGVGLRYVTGFGPLRLDVGFPLHREPGGASFEAYIGLGEAF